MASDLSVLPTQSLIGPALGPVMAAFSRINDNRERLRNAFLKAARFTMMLSVPTSVGLSLTSDLIIDVLLGPKWNEAATYLQWLALSIVLSAYYQSLYSLALATNRPNIIFRSSLIELCTRIVLVSSGLYFYSLMGAIGARAAASLVLFISSLLYVRKLVGLSVATQLGNLWQIGAACFLMALMVLLFRYNVAGKNLHLLVELGLTAIFGAMVYVGALYALGVRLRGDIADLTNRSNRS
jgi:PST family polysaccharide transporter